MANSQPSSSKSEVLAPLLFEHAVTRTGIDHIPGEYCPVRHVWVVEGRPMVHTPSSLVELVTKTDALPERDDANEASLELQTKTKHQIERDDEDFELHALELMTKTLSQIERDDENPTFVDN